MRRASGAALLVAFALSAGVACRNGQKPGLDLPSVSGGVPSPDPAPPSIDRSPGSSAAAMATLCVGPVFPSPSAVVPSTEIDPAIVELKDHVEFVRGLRFLDPVAAEAISRSEMARRTSDAYRIQYPKDLYARRTQAWTTIGVLPEGVGLRESLLSFGRGGVVGYYDPSTGELVYVGSGSLGFAETLILAHELTHAIDDQHFDLSRLDALVEGCRDEEFLAAVGVVEGSAQFFATRVLEEFPSPAGPGDLGLAGDLGALDAVPPFLQELQSWPYLYGHAFVIALSRRGGVELVNRALEEPPASTEQVLHPERYPNDLPRPVNVPSLGAPGWTDLDVMQVGEEWIRGMLELRIDRPTADAAAAGWDGGTYRAFTDGDHVGIVMRTVWDSRADADEFRRAVELWIGEGKGFATVRSVRATATALFATDDQTMDLIAATYP